MPYTVEALHCSFNAVAVHYARKLWMPISIVFGLTRPGIEPEYTVSGADALSSRPLIGAVIADLQNVNFAIF